MKKSDWNKIARQEPVIRIAPLNGRLTKQVIGYRLFDEDGDEVINPRYDFSQVPPDSAIIRFMYFAQHWGQVVVGVICGSMITYLLTVKYGVCY